MKSILDWFNWKSRARMYTFADVQADIAAAAIILLSEPNEIPEQASVPAVISKDAKLLAEFGFSNAKNAEYIQPVVKKVKEISAEHQEKMQLLGFMEDVWRKFGKDTLVVRYDHFFKILEKYDMVCGTFGRYTGTVPTEALSILTKLKGHLQGEYRLPFKTINLVYYDIEKTSRRSLLSMVRMPLISGNRHVQSIMENITGSNLYLCEATQLGSADGLFIAAPAADMKPLDLRIEFMGGFHIGEKALRDAERWNSNLRDFPYAYAHEREEIQRKAIRKVEERVKGILIEGGIGRYCKCDFVRTELSPKRVVDDPFICSLTPYGVMIHAKWGAEAEDATIKRYEQLRDTVIQNGLTS